MTKVRLLVVTGLAVILGLTFGGSALAQTSSVGDLPGMSTTGAQGGIDAAGAGNVGNFHRAPAGAESVLDLPAQRTYRDAAGNVYMDLPGLDLYAPASPHKCCKQHAPKRLPVTGMNAGDLAAMGGAALAAGGVLLRRVRMALAS